MSKLVPTRALLRKLASDAIASAVAGPFTGGLGGAKMVVYTEPISADADTVLGDLTQPDPADWSGYAPAAVTWGAVVSAGDGSYVVQGALVPWSLGPGEPATNLAGYGLVDAAGAVLLAIEQFDSLMPLVNADDAVTVGPQFKFDASGDFGQAAILAP